MNIPNIRKLQQIASIYSPGIDFKGFMKFCKDYTKEPYLFLVNNTTLSSDNPLRCRKNLLKKWLLLRKRKVSVKNSSKT